MKRALIAAMVAVILMGQQLSEAAQTERSQKGNTASNPGDIPPAEYNAYKAALEVHAPGGTGVAMEAFVKQYPQSLLLIDALEQAARSYQSIHNQNKMRELLNRILLPMPSNLRELAVTVVLARDESYLTNRPMKEEACGYAQTGLQQMPGWAKPEGVTDSDFAKMRNLMADIFYGAVGYCAFNSKDYAHARDSYEKALQLDPTNVPDVWQLAIADLEMKPIDVNGLWYCAKAIILEKNEPALNFMPRYCMTQYKKHGGSEAGWDQIVKAVAKGDALPVSSIAALTK
jgi:tetratricopeptide (TPR) repeat protein